MVDAAQARKVIKGKNWIDGTTSRNVLRSIIFGKTPMDAYTDDPRVNEMVRTLKAEYWRIRSSCGENAPRNLPFLKLVARRYPGFNWCETAGSINWPVRVDGVAPSLLTLLMGLIPEDEFDAGRAGTDDPLARALLGALEAAEVVPPEPDVLADVVAWLRRGQAGEPLTIVSPVCPDYEVEDGTVARHRFTFRNLGATAGLTARRLFSAMPPLDGFLRRQLGLHIRHIVCPGDFEGLSDEVNARMGIDRAEFMARLEQGRRDIERIAPGPVEARFFTDLCGGQPEWQRIHAQAHADIRGEGPGQVRELDWVRRLAVSRAELYRRWYGNIERPEQFYLEKVLQQGAEYFAMGQIILGMSGYPNPLVLGADDHRMGRFYRLAGNLPVLYVRRNYE